MGGAGLFARGHELIGTAISAPCRSGSGGARFGQNPTLPGNGGGVVRIVADSVDLEGSILADGNPPAVTQGGAGSGGAIYIRAGTLVGAGSVSASGGTGNAVGAGSRSSAVGGVFGHGPRHGGSVPGTGIYGGAGTIYRRSPAEQYGELIVDNENIATSGSATALRGFDWSSVIAVAAQ